MPRGKTSTQTFTPNEAKYILETLVRKRQVTAAQIASVRQDMENEKQSLLARLQALGALPAVTVAAVAGSVVAGVAPKAARKVRKVVRQVSADRAHTRELQGRYLGLLRQIPATAKKQFGKDAIKTKGKEAVLREMESFISQQGGSAKAPRKRRTSKKK